MAYDDNLLQPAKHYSATLKQKISDLANGHFDKIIEKGQIDVEANRETVKKYNNASEELKKEQLFHNGFGKYRRAKQKGYLKSGLFRILLEILIHKSVKKYSRGSKRFRETSLSSCVYTFVCSA